MRTGLGLNQAIIPVLQEDWTWLYLYDRKTKSCFNWMTVRVALHLTLPEWQENWTRLLSMTRWVNQALPVWQEDWTRLYLTGRLKPGKTWTKNRSDMALPVWKEGLTRQNLNDKRTRHGFTCMTVRLNQAYLNNKRAGPSFTLIVRRINLAWQPYGRKTWDRFTCMTGRLDLAWDFLDNKQKWFKHLG